MLGRAHLRSARVRVLGVGAEALRRAAAQPTGGNASVGEAYARGAVGVGIGGLRGFQRRREWRRSVRRDKQNPSNVSIV